MNASAILANITFYDLNLTNYCSDLALGLSIYQNNFNNSASSNDFYSSPQDAYHPYYPDGPSEDWTTFWRAALGSKDRNFSNDNIVVWANDTPFINFFVDNYSPQPDKIDQLATDLSLYQGGCPSSNLANQTSSYGYGPSTLTELVEACMVDYCCAPNRTDQQLQDNSTAFPFYPKWSVDDTCAFRTCPAANHGNPDLGGIGVRYIP